ncbi:MAG: T9SS type A sorting domain-containing protein [Ignavibacteria bacterium]|nr:T9SS type A sorting domain-containing protein [Ignavibacteria bacterium]
MKKTLLLLAIVLLFSANGYTQYLTQDFEGAWSGSPEAPSGWTQSRTVLMGNGIPDAITVTTGEKDWQKNTNTGAATWSLTPTTPGTVPNAAISGTGVAWLQTRDFGGSGQNWGSRRLETPTINLSGSTSPYVRFWMYWADGSTVTNIRIMGSSNGGATWLNIQQFTPNFTLSSTPSASSPWSRITVKIPAAFKTANMKIGIEVTSPWGANNLFIDDFSVEEFTPTTITSTGAGGLWSATGTWVGGVVPTADNNVVIAAGATVNADVNIARMQNLQVDGILQYNSTTTTMLVQAFGDFTVSATGTYNSFSGTTGKRTYIGGNINNAGTINFGISATSVSEAALIWFGYGPYTFTNTGTISFSKINTIWCAVTQGVTFNSPVTNTTRFVLGLGTVNPNGNLTLGSSGATTTMTIERHKGSFTTAPTFGAGVTRAVSYLDGTGVASTLGSQVAPCNRQNVTPGEEVEIVTATRTVLGTLLISTHGNVQLGYPMNVGNGTTGGLTLTRGILITDNTNILRIASNITVPAGTAPSTATPSTSHGSFISGPVRVDLPTSASSRNFPLGVGTAYNDSVPTANVLKTLSVSSTTAWTAGTSVTGTIEAKPTGSVVGPLQTLLGTRSYRLNLNGGSDLNANATVSIIGNNYTYGSGAGSDSLLGNQQNLFVAQSTTVAGSWTARSISSGTGAITNNTNYTRTTATAAPGPIAPLATNGEYFCFATDASPAPNVGPQTLTPSGSAYYASTSVNIPMTGTIINTGLSATTNPVTVTRKIIGTAYTSSVVVPAGIGANATANTTFADFTGWTAGVTYQIKDSTYMLGDGSATNDTLSVFFTPNVPKPVLVYYGTDTRSRDSIVSHMAGLGLASQYDLVASFPAGVPLSLWRTIVFLSPSGYNFTANTPVRDSLKLWLDGSTPSAKRSLVLFGNDIGYYMDIRRNASATAADTTFYRQYLHAAFFTDDWVDNFVASDSTLKGTGSAPWNTITGQRINDPYPDCIQPAIWNNTGGTPYGALFPTTESGDGDSCGAVAYNGTNYNTFYMSCVYSSISPTVSGALSPQGVVLNVIKTYVEGVNGVFPVELASFTSSIDKRNVTLKWSTNNEENNAGFDIERRVSGTSEWNKVGNVAGAGNSNSIKKYSFDDRNLASARYQYRLKQMDFNGNYKYYELGNEVIIGVPSRFDISQNYPNPFNPSTKINFDLPFDSKVQIKVFDMTGREISQIVNEAKTAGYYTVNFNASALASGVYFYQINATGGSQSFVKTMKMVLVK